MSLRQQWAQAGEEIQAERREVYEIADGRDRAEVMRRRIQAEEHQAYTWGRYGFSSTWNTAKTKAEAWRRVEAWMDSQELAVFGMDAYLSKPPRRRRWWRIRTVKQIGDGTNG